MKLVTGTLLSAGQVLCRERWGLGSRLPLCLSALTACEVNSVPSQCRLAFPSQSFFFLTAVLWECFQQSLGEIKEIREDREQRMNYRYPSAGVVLTVFLPEFPVLLSPGSRAVQKGACEVRGAVRHQGHLEVQPSHRWGGGAEFLPQNWSWAMNCW